MTDLARPAERRSPDPGQRLLGGPPGPASYEPEPQRRTRPAEPPADLGPRRGSHASSRGQDFGYVVGWTILGTLVPGSGLVAAGRRALGWTLIFLQIAAIGIAAGYAATQDSPMGALLSLKDVALDPAKLRLVAAGIIAAGALWAIVMLVTHAALRQEASLDRRQQVLAGALVAALLGAIAVPTAKGAQYALITQDLLTSVFGKQRTSTTTAKPQVHKADPWAGTKRINILLMGSDAGPDRTGLRPDSIIQMSIDTHTGESVMFSLPRNLQGIVAPEGTPMRDQYPMGYRCEEVYHGVRQPACLLNSVWMWGEQHKSLFPGEEEPGLIATEQAVEGITGLKTDYYAMLDLKGFEEFVDAIGGVTLHPRERLPMGGNTSYRVATLGWIEPGKQHMDGFHALWYARSRWTGTDYDRMLRQRCAIAAVAQQSEPLTLVRKFPKIAKAIKRNFETDIPLNQLSAWADLAQRIQKGGIRSLPFTNEVISTVNPDFDRVHLLVEKSLKSTKKPKPSVSASTQPSPGSSAGTTPKTKKKPKKVRVDQANNISDVC